MVNTISYKQVFYIIVLTVIFSIVLFGSNHHSVWASQCSFTYMSTIYEESSSVFSGKVIDITGIFLSKNANYRFEVDTVFKGNVPDIVDVEVNDRTNTVHFREGYDYVVFSKTNGHIPYYVGSCYPHMHPIKTVVKLLETGAPDFIDSDGFKLSPAIHIIERIMESDELEYIKQLETEEWKVFSSFTSYIPYFPPFWYFVLASVAGVMSLLMILCHVYKKSKVSSKCICNMITQNKLWFVSAILSIGSLYLNICIYFLHIFNNTPTLQDGIFAFLVLWLLSSYSVLFVLWMRQTRWYLTIPLMALMLFWLFVHIVLINSDLFVSEYFYVSDMLIVSTFSVIAISFGIVSCVRWIVSQLKSGSVKL